LKENHHNSAEEKNSNPDEPPDNNVTTKYETIEDGTEAFMQWMGSSDKNSLSSGNPIVLIKFINDVSTILYDTTLSNNVEVKLTGVYPSAIIVNLMTAHMLVLPFA
jgi:hypothetical protein